MKNSNKKANKRRALIILFWAFIVLIICSFTSYAYITLTVDSKEENTVTTGCLKLSSTESEGINLKNAQPMLDASGMNTIPYKFTITNTCSLDASYTLSLNIIDGSNIDDGENIKVAVNGDLTVEPQILSSFRNNYLNDPPKDIIKSYYLTKSNLLVGESKSYDIRMWIDYDATELSNDFVIKLLADAVVMED